MRNGMKDMETHLTSDDLERALAGRPLAQVAEHVSQCARCAGEIAGAREMFAELRESAVVTAERYQRMGLGSAKVKSPWRAGGMAWGLVAAMLCVGVIAPVALRHRAVAVPVLVSAGPAEGAAQMSDEALLTSVQDDLSTSVPEPLLPLAGSGGSSTTDNMATQRTTK